MKDVLEKFLSQFFGYKQFRRGQREIIEDACNGKDVLGILPTGTGKSICYQLPARILPGTVLVVSPLISLMIDQVKQMRASGFKEVIAFNSFMDFNEKRRALANLQGYKLIYVSPEMLQQKEFLAGLKRISIPLFVVDEAHCISQWGHEFRPDYLRLAAVVKELKKPPVMALSATATPEVQEDILKQLNIQQAKKHIYPMDRENIAFVVEYVSDNESKLEFLANQLDPFPGPAMIYFSSRAWTEKAVEYFNSRLPDLTIAFYHGGMDQADRILIQQQFMNGQLDLICCTNAFGMGINKPDIRLVVHFHLPSRIESFIQEVGRAGRDGKQSVSVLLIAPNDDYIPRKLIESELPDVFDVEGILFYIKSELDLHAKLPDEEEILVRLGINETQWRFLLFHLEKHQLTDLAKNLKPSAKWEAAAKEIKDFIISRNHYKNQKLSELLIWAYEKGCRRSSLFASFQSSVTKPEKTCCDRCGFQLKDWNADYRANTRSYQSWQSAFDHLMLRESLYEPE